jgi:hypothetical protein
MSTPTDTLSAREAAPVAQLHVDDDTVEVFIRDGEPRRVVVAALDRQGRPTRVAEWDVRARGMKLRGLMR